MRNIRAAIGATTINPELLTSAERLQYEGFLRREETNASIITLAKQKVSIKQIVRRTGYSRWLVRQNPQRRAYGCLPNPAKFAGGSSSVARYSGRWLPQRCQAVAISQEQWLSRIPACRLGMGNTSPPRGENQPEQLQRIPSARTIARLMTTVRDTLSKSETMTIAAIESGVKTLVEARETIAAFHAMIRGKAEIELTSWLVRARQTFVASFANGVTQDEAAVRAAITSAWSNGQTEGQITRLKLVKRQMNGRGKIDLLQARLIGAE
jgi:transposase